MVQTLQYFKDLFITGYQPTQQDYIDMFDTLTNLEVIVGASGVVPNGSSIGNYSGGAQLFFNNNKIEHYGFLKLLAYAGGPSDKILYIDSSGLVKTKVLPKTQRMIINQSGTNPPTEVNIQNDITGISAEYDSVGMYRLFKAGGFPLAKTFVNKGNNELVQGEEYGDILIVHQDDDTLVIQTLDISNVNTDGLLLNFALEIIVYP